MSGKLTEIDGHYYRMRRGKLVQIPDEWVGKTTHPHSKRKRRSRFNAAQRRNISSHPLKDGTIPNSEYREKRYQMIDDEANIT